jgi:predicted O-methyltransferase YrrM
VGSFSASSSRPSFTPEQAGQALEPQRSLGTRENFAKRWFVQCARKLHDFPFVFNSLAAGFRVLQRVGVNITPNHYYWPVPDLAELERRDWSIYPAPVSCRFDLKQQAELAYDLATNYCTECRFSEEPQDGAYHYNNGYFEAVDAEVAYCIARHFKPAHVVEIGTGYSTRVLAAALEKNLDRDQLEGQLISIDPYPERFSVNGWRNRVVQIPKAVQDVDLEFFDSLESGDILFIDSSHVVATGSDVICEFLHILPRLQPGVLVHVHDIFLPSDYPRDAVLNRLWFWSEQYLLQAFLSFNSSFEVLWNSSAMQIYYPWVLEQCFPSWKHSYRKMPESKRRFVPTMDGERVWPSSFWMRRL